MSKANPALTALDAQLAAQNQVNKNKNKTFIIYDDQENNMSTSITRLYSL